MDTENLPPAEERMHHLLLKITDEDAAQLMLGELKEEHRGLVLEDLGPSLIAHVGGTEAALAALDAATGAVLAVQRAAQAQSG